eukprot:scaffold442_cov268-Pinguiococcus_pyrenoidosus.AAC.108
MHRRPVEAAVLLQNRRAVENVVHIHVAAEVAHDDAALVAAHAYRRESGLRVREGLHDEERLRSCLSGPLGRRNRQRVHVPGHW